MVKDMGVRMLPSSESLWLHPQQILKIDIKHQETHIRTHGLENVSILFNVAILGCLCSNLRGVPDKLIFHDVFNFQCGGISCKDLQTF